MRLCAPLLRVDRELEQLVQGAYARFADPVQLRAQGSIIECSKRCCRCRAVVDRGGVFEPLTLSQAVHMHVRVVRAGDEAAWFHLRHDAGKDIGVDVAAARRFDGHGLADCRTSRVKCLFFAKAEPNFAIFCGGRGVDGQVGMPVEKHLLEARVCPSRSTPKRISLSFFEKPNLRKEVFEIRDESLVHALVRRCAHVAPRLSAARGRAGAAVVQPLLQQRGVVGCHQRPERAGLALVVEVPEHRISVL